MLWVPMAPNTSNHLLSILRFKIKSEFKKKMSNWQIGLGNLSHISYDHHVLLFTYKDNWRGRPELQMGSQPGDSVFAKLCAV